MCLFQGFGITPNRELRMKKGLNVTFPGMGAKLSSLNPSSSHSLGSLDSVDVS
jgi:hypothetical protein